MKLLENIFNLLAEEWKKLSSIYKLWSLFCFLLEFLVISLLQDEIITNLKRINNQHYIWLFLLILILIIPVSTYSIAWLICRKKPLNSEIKSQDNQVTNIQNPETQNKEEEIIKATNHSVIEKKVINGQIYIIKKTLKKFCDISALRKLIDQNIMAKEGDTYLYIATPSNVWIENDYVVEQIPYHEGITLHQLITNNQCLFTWDLLGEILNCLIIVTNELHQINVIHRDIVPSNLLIRDDGCIILIDCSFCCNIDTKQIPIFNREFSAPEQKHGKAVFSSDWYSIATTIYFLANGFSPPWNDEKLLQKGFENINFGSIEASEKFLKNLTNKDINSRPIEISRCTIETAIPREIILGVFKLNKKYLVNYHHEHITIDKKEISAFLTSVLKEERIEPNNQKFKDILKSIIELNQEKI